MPNPSTGHGWILKDNILEPLWTSGNILPQQMLDILDTHEDDECSNADSDMERDDLSSRNMRVMMMRRAMMRVIAEQVLC